MAFREILYSVSLLKDIGREPVCSKVTKSFTPIVDPDTSTALSRKDESCVMTALER